MTLFGKKDRVEDYIPNPTTSDKKVIGHIPLEISIKKLHESAHIPKYINPEAECLEVRAIDHFYDDKIDCFVYKTGLSFNIPKGYTILVSPPPVNKNIEYYLVTNLGSFDTNNDNEFVICYKSRDRNINKSPFSGDEVVAYISIVYSPIVEFVVAKS